MSKNVCLVTCFLDNFGACLQAYALQTKITEINGNCDILNYVVPSGYRKSKLSFLYKLSGYTLLRRLIDKKYRQNYNLGKCREKIFDSFRKKHLTFSKFLVSNDSQLKQSIDYYDLFVCGSDQIWNPTFYGKCNPAYYLAFVPENVRKVAYAPSIGVSSIQDEYKNQFIEYINRIDCLSVREETGAKIIKGLTGKEAKVVLDPTLLLTREEWASFSENSKIKTNKPYIFCYFFGKNDYSQVIEYFKIKLKLDAYIIPFNSEQETYLCKKIRKVGPVEFVNLIKNARLVLTDSFHATAFSVNLNTPFYVFKRDFYKENKSMNSRVLDFLEITRLNRRLLDVSLEFDIDDYTIDYGESNTILEELRNNCYKYLKKALL